MGHLGVFQETTIRKVIFCHKKYQTAILDVARISCSYGYVSYNSLIRNDIPHAYVQRDLSSFFFSFL